MQMGRHPRLTFNLFKGGFGESIRHETNFSAWRTIRLLLKLQRFVNNMMTELCPEAARVTTSKPLSPLFCLLHVRAELAFKVCRKWYTVVAVVSRCALSLLPC